MTTDHIEFTRRDAAHLIHPVTSPKDLANGDLRVIVEGDGLFIKDDKGNTLIDGFAGLWCVAVGHGRKEIADAIAEQLATLEYGTTFHGQSHPKAIELAEKLSQMFDPSYGLNHVLRGVQKRTKQTLKWFAFTGLSKVKIDERLLWLEIMATTASQLPR